MRREQRELGGLLDFPSPEAGPGETVLSWKPGSRPPPDSDPVIHLTLAVSLRPVSPLVE